MPITKLKFKPGITSDVTDESNEGGYVDGDKVRFRLGFPEKIGGWSKYSPNTFQGSARKLHNWAALDGSDYLGVGTHLKYYIEEGQLFNDITPIRNTTALGDITFSASASANFDSTGDSSADSTLVTIVDPAHGANENDFVTLSGVPSLGGNVTATLLNAEHQITSIISSNSYTITLSVLATGSDTGNGTFADATCDYNNDPTITMDSTASLIVGGTVSGTGIPAGATIDSITDGTNFELSASTTGGSVTNGTLTFNTSKAVYQINTGLNTTVGGTGWGAGQWSGTTSGALATQLAEAVDNNETAVDVDDETGIETNNDIIFINKTPSSVSTTLSAAISSTGATTISVTSASGLAVGDTIVIGSEFVKIGGISTNDLTSCTRSHLRSTASTHPSGTSVFLVDGPELMTVSATTDDNTLTVARGSSGTIASAHADDTLVRLAVGNEDSANDFVGWGNAASVTVPGAQIRLWTHDNFGQHLLLNPRDGSLYLWFKDDGVSSRALELSASNKFKDGSGATLTATSVPTIAKQILVSDQDRHVIAFGCDSIGATSTATQGNGVQDPLLIRFSSQENPVDWYPTEANTAGDLRLGGGSTFVQAVETKQQVLVFTNKTLHGLKYIGAAFTFGLQELSKNITIMGPSAAIAVDDSVFWMGVDAFYAYAGGQTQQMPCTVKDKVFLDFNMEERDKVHTGVNSEFGEIIWFYPTASSAEIDAYVVYNYLERLWYYGTMARQAWLDRGIRALPIATGGSYLYNHEFGYDDDGSAMTSFIESAPVDIGDGEKFVFLRRVIPDITFAGSTSTNPDVAFTMKAKNFPGSNFNETTQGTTQRSATSPVEQFTEKLDYRLRGRSFALRIDSTSVGTKYKLGSPRVDIREDGKR